MWGARLNETPDRPELWAAAESIAKTEDPTRATSGTMHGAYSRTALFQHDVFAYDDFSTNFVARGNLLICRNFDSCGKIGFVGNRLGAEGVNISFMTVAPLEKGVGEVDEGKTNEALMILGVDKLVEDEIRKGLIGEEGVLECTAVTL